MGAMLHQKNLLSSDIDRKILYDGFSNSLDSILGRIQINVVEHCNLGCKYCIHFSCIAKEQYYNVENYEKEISNLSRITNKTLLQLDLAGGEPLLHPRINDMARISRKYFPDTTINIITNAVLLDSMDESFWKTMHKNRIRIFPTVYPIKINWMSILNKAKKYDVAIVKDYVNNERFTISDSDKKKMFFKKMKLNEKGYTNLAPDHCIYNCDCAQMHNNKIYPCPIIPHSYHLNEKFGTNFKVVDGMDNIDLDTCNSVEDIHNFFKGFKQQDSRFPFCKFCIPREKTGLTWENVPEHSIEEWT